MTSSSIERRGLLKLSGLGLTGFLLGTGRTIAAQDLPPPSPVDRGHVDDGKVKFPEWRREADMPSSPPPAPLAPEKRVGFAVVALGRLSLEQILPAFSESKKAKLVALVSGSPEKLKAVANQYGVKESACYTYETFDTIKDNPEIKAVYIVLPNSMHREFTERAARAGKHVLTEKPMATTSDDARAMIDTCKAADVKLMVAYRIQYEAYNLRLAELARSKTFGRLVGMSAINVQTVAEDGWKQWRHKKAMAGGGSLFDIGLYCLNTARFVTGEEPVEIMAMQYSPPGDERYAEVEETIAFMLRFPSSAIVNCFASYGARNDKHQRLNFETATVDMPNAYAFFAYATNYLIDLDNAVIVDVKASRQAEVGAARTMIDRTQDSFGLYPGRLAADSAYGSAEMLGWLVHERDLYTCPGGKELRFRLITYKNDRPLVDEDCMVRYRASKLDCDACALEPRCCPNAPARKIPRSIHEGARDMARDIAKTEAYIPSRHQRKKIEMLFAHLKRILRLDRLRLRGPNGARDEFHLAAAALNLRKLAKLNPVPMPKPA